MGMRLQASRDEHPDEPRPSHRSRVKRDNRLFQAFDRFL